MTHSPELTQAVPSQPADPLPEAVGRYQVLGCLGSGGMGTVYKAHDPHLDRVVAVKLPRFEGPQPDRLRRVQRFQREARTAARLWHPHVCPIYDVGEHEGQPFVVMPFVEGQSLAQRLAGQGRYEDPRQAVAIIRQILDALDAVHRHGIIHRDLKDGNILLDEKGRAVLTDFGLARPENDAEHLTSDGVILGTPSFMAPEIAAGRPDEVGPWTDLFSLGVVLYRMLTGRLPFEGPALTVLCMIVHEDPVPPSRWRPDLDPALEAIVLKALARDSGRRYRSAEEFAKALEDWSGRGGESVSPVGSATEQLVTASPGNRPGGAEETTVAASLDQPGWETQSHRRRLVQHGCLLGGLGLLGLGALTLTLLLLNLLGREVPTSKKAATTKAFTRGSSDLIREAEKGHLVRVQEILQMSANPNVKDEHGETALMKAAARGHTEVVQALLGRVEANEIDELGETALMKAAENGHADVVEIMLGRVAINLKDDQGQTALMKAKAKNHTRVVEILKKAGAKE